LAIASQSLAVRAFDDIAIAAIEPAARTPIAALAGKQALSAGGTIAAARLVAAFEVA